MNPFRFIRRLFILDPASRELFDRETEAQERAERRGLPEPEKLLPEKGEKREEQKP